MREIKFRAWDKREKIMGEVNYIRFSKGYRDIEVIGNIFDNPELLESEGQS